MGLANSRGGWSTVQLQWGHCSGDATCPTRMVQNSSAELIRANERRLRNCQRIEARSLEVVLGCLPPHPACSAGILSGCLAGMGTHLALEQNESGRRHRLALACNCRANACCSYRRLIHPGALPGTMLSCLHTPVHTRWGAHNRSIP
jgi:hypothetical protein